ncbi:TonB-dependent receptor [Lysobacter enzymogenes]|nr:TonB-dependent receptor [Lysobacter enzymogenes]UZW58592.1 TonB-dependent receptor [Lysobacter enzymogenes]
MPLPRSAALRRTALHTALALASSAGAAFAQPPQDAAASDTVTRLDTVTVQAQDYDPRRDDTASRIVVASDELTRYGDDTLADALKRLPGVSVSDGAGGGAIALRGLGKGYTQVLIDGRAAPPGFDPATLRPDQVERIELLRTTTADLRGEAIAGTINIVLAKQARRDRDRLTFALKHSGNGFKPSAAWSRTRRGDASSSSFDASVLRNDHQVDERGIEQAFDDAGAQTLARRTDLRARGVREQLSLAPAAERTLANGDRIAWRSGLEVRRHRKRGDIHWSTSLGPELDHTDYRQRTDLRLLQLRNELAWTHGFASGARLETKLNLDGNRERTRYREDADGRDGARNLEEATDSRLDVRNHALSGKYSFAVRGAHTVQAGWDLGQDRRSERRVQRLAEFPGFPGKSTDQSFDARIRRSAAYLQDEWSPTPRWSLYLGARWERIDIRSAGSDFAPLRNDAQLLTPVLQSLWKLAVDQRLRLGLSRSYRAPELRELTPRPYTSTNNRALDPDRQGNPALRPELATGLDLAYERDWGEAATLSVGGYARRIEDFIGESTRLLDGRWVASPLNTGDARSHGLELDGKLSLAKLRKRAPDLDIGLQFNRHWSRVDAIPGPDNRVDRQPRYTGGLSLDYRPAPHWTLGAAYTHRSGGPVRTAAREIEAQTPKRELDAYALWKRSDDAQLRLTLTNLLRQDGGESFEYLDEGQRLRQQRWRKSTLGVRLEWQVGF